MDQPEYLFLVAAIAFLYSTVGHGGASGYIAVFTLAGASPAQVRPVALMLNVLVATLATYKFWRAGYFKPGLFIPIATLSIPAAMLGGFIELPHRPISILIGTVLLCSAVWLMTGRREPQSVAMPSQINKFGVGGTIGFVAGLTGTGGGIFLSPLMVYLRWGKLQEVSAIAAPFILVNSIAGLVGLSAAGHSVPTNWPQYVLVAAVGGFAGSTIGARLLNPKVIQALLSTVLLIAGSKILLTA